MLRFIVLLAAITGASIGLADDGTTSLADAVRAINAQAAKLPESHGHVPLTVDEVVKSLELFPSQTWAAR